MKIYVVNDFKNGDSFDSYYFDLEDAKKEAEYIWDHLTDSEKEEREIMIIGYEISVDGYRGSAEKLVRELYDGSLSCEEFDGCFGFDDGAAFYQRIFENKK